MHSERLFSFNCDSEVTIAPACSWEESWTLSDVLVVLTKGSLWMLLAWSSIPDYNHSQVSWPQSNCCLPLRRFACCCHLTGRGCACHPRNPDGCSSLAASLQGSCPHETTGHKKQSTQSWVCLPCSPGGPPETHLNPPVGPHGPAPALLQAAALPWDHGMFHRLRARACQQSLVYCVRPDAVPITCSPIPCAGNAADLCYLFLSLLPFIYQA